MTKTSKSGVVKDKHHESRDLDKFLGDKFETVGQKDKWFGQEMEVQSDPLVDSGTGKPVVMRFFEFKADPITFKRDNPTNQQLFNSHAQQIKTFLWRDGLEPLEIMEPRIIRAKKQDGYRIMITCQPRPGVILAESTQTLQQLTKQSNG